MDVDKDVDGRLAQQFGCLGTVDKEVLIGQFQQILGPYVNLSSESCRFFLDMNNWNLQAAVGSYYDYNAQDLIRLPSMVFVKDVTIGEGESVPPNTKFLKIWRLQNAGGDAWPDGCSLKHIAGEIQADTDSIMVKSMPAHEFVDVSVEMTSPLSKGIYQSRWQMNTPNGIPFGETIWCIIVVEENGLLSLTQRLAAAHCTEEAIATASFTSSENKANYSNVFRTSGRSRPTEHSAPESCTPVESVGICSSIFNARNAEPSSLSLVQAPSDPNFNRSLCSAISASFPSTSSQQQSPGNVISVDVAGTMLSDANSSVPCVPPCTPCSPEATVEHPAYTDLRHQWYLECQAAELLRAANVNGDSKMDEQ